MLTLSYDNVPDNPIRLNVRDLNTVIDALSFARNNTAIADAALSLEVRLIDWADNTGIDPTEDTIEGTCEEVSS